MIRPVPDALEGSNDKSPAQTLSKPAVSVVTVIDFSYQGDRVGDNIKATIAALAAQDFDGAMEFIVPETADRVSLLPPELKSILPSLKILPCNATSSYELMNAGVRAASADIVAIIDGDCTPCREWIRLLVETLSRNPNATGVSGLTSYAGSTATERVMALLARSYMNPGGSGPTRYFSNNNGGMRREVWLRHPLPTHAGPYASRLQTEAIWREGGRFLLSPACASSTITKDGGWNSISAAITATAA